MPPEPVPADPGWDEDLAWLDRDPERETWLDRAARLTPGALRAAIARAVIEVAPEKAKERRETATKFARVERWREDSGNAALAGRELPPDEVLAVDERVTWWADELRKAGLEGGTDAIRARALLDLLLNKDSRPHQDQPNPVGAAPGGFAGRANLTVPLATLTSLAGRPGELAGLGPIDPWLARDLATAAAANPKSTWCVTVTDEHGHAIGHGCARPEPKNQRKRAGPGPPGFTFSPASRDGPPGGYGTWRLRTPGNGPDLLVTLDPLTIGSSSTPSGRSTSSRTVPSGGPPQPGVPTPPNPRDTRYEEPTPRLRTLASPRDPGGRPAGRPGRRAPG
jgi:hypothetical protein